MAMADRLTQDEWRCIISRLPIEALPTAACVCRLWRSIASDLAVIVCAFKSAWKLDEVVGSPVSANFWHGAGSLSCFAISHRIKRGDSVTHLAVKYGVQVPEIRRMNYLMSDHSIYSRERLLIPVTKPDILEGRICYIEMDIYSRREVAVIYVDDSAPKQPLYHDVLKRTRRWLLESMKKAMKLDEDEANYYLSAANGDFRAALSELKEDIEWERKIS